MTTFLFTDNATAQTVTVTETFARLDYTEAPSVDVFAFGRSFGVALGDLSNPHHSVTYDVTAQRMVDGQPKGPAHHLQGTIQYGQYHVRHRGNAALEIQPHLQRWVDWQLAGVNPGIVSLDVIHDEDLEYPEDQEQTESTGSGRLHTMRSPPMLQAMLRDALDLTQYAGGRPDVDAWVRYQGLRGLNFYDSAKGYAPILAEHGTYIGRGYGKSGGGFSTLYSCHLPAGVTWTNTGLQVPHATHLTIDGLICAAYLYGDAMALRMAIHTIQAVGTSALAGEKWSSRAYGRFFISVAQLAPAIASKVPGTENIQELVVRVLERLTSANRGGCPAPDNGKTAEGSNHLLNADVAAFCSRFGITDPVLIQDLARSDASWFVSQLWYGLTALKELFGMYGLDTSLMVEHQRTFAHDFLGLAATAGISVDGTGKAGRPATGIWAEVSATALPNGYRLAEGGGWGDVDNTVFTRFLMPALMLIDSTGESWQAMYDYCKANGTWGPGGYEGWATENYAALSRTGWDD